MPQIFFPNLMFEDELEVSGRQLSAEPRQLISELAPVMGLLGSGSDDKQILLVEPNFIPTSLPATLSHLHFEPLTQSNLCNLSSCYDDNLQFVPWGWSRSAITIQQQLQPSATVPDRNVVRRVNSREFHAGFDVSQSLQDSNAAVDDAGQLCHSLTDLFESLAKFAARGYSRWVIKSNYSQAARNRLLGIGATPDASQTNWLARRFAAGEPVYAEPWYDRLAECGLQFWIPPLSDAVTAIRFEGACEMLTDAVGRYRGSIVTRPESTEYAWWRSAVPRCHAIAMQARELGFSGAIGMDCMLFRHPCSGERQLRFCHDINGRFTMGRVALELRRWLEPGETGFWCHASAKTAGNGYNVFGNLDMKSVRIVPTSPSKVGSQSPDLQTALVISADCESLIQVARKILSQDIRGPFQFC